jgi:hypothetical protein
LCLSKVSIVRLEGNYTSFTIQLCPVLGGRDLLLLPPLYSVCLDYATTVPVLLVYKIAATALLLQLNRSRHRRVFPNERWVRDRCIGAGYFNSALLTAAAFPLTA